MPAPQPSQSGLFKRSSVIGMVVVGLLAAIVVALTVVVYLYRASGAPHSPAHVFSTRTPVVPPTATLGVGSNAPNFTLDTLDGSHKVRLSDFSGRPVILNFWSLRCSVCVQETPLLQHFYTTEHSQGKELEMVGVNLDRTADFTQVAQFQDAQGLTYPMLVDDHFQARMLYQISTEPTTFFIDRTGTIRAIVAGALSQEIVQQKAALIA